MYYKLERFCKDLSYILKFGNSTLYRPTSHQIPGPHPCLNFLLLIFSCSFILHYNYKLFFHIIYILLSPLIIVFCLGYKIIGFHVVSSCIFILLKSIPGHWFHHLHQFITCSNPCVCSFLSIFISPIFKFLPYLNGQFLVLQVKLTKVWKLRLFFI